jgi:hypothetical protein
MFRSGKNTLLVHRMYLLRRVREFARHGRVCLAAEHLQPHGVDLAATGGEANGCRPILGALMTIVIGIC